MSVDPDARAHLDELWGSLSDGGKALMPLQEYPFSPHYGWIEDRYGVSWQLMLTNPEGEPRPFIIPSIMFGHTVQGRAQEAMDFYLSVFGGRPGAGVPYPAEAGALAGQVMRSPTSSCSTSGSPPWTPPTRTSPSPAASR
ncbi:MAG: VOC family protein [Micropruina sp.]